jgi:hypothetical protein
MRVLFYIFWAAVLIASTTLASDATWKPEYAKNPPAVTAWFREARVPGGCDTNEKAKAWKRLGIFVSDVEGDWSYYPDPECTTKGCLLKPIPNDIVHQDGIRALNPYDDRLPEFDQMRREGVLFIYQGQPACFWPPEQSDG